jgi:hypothetical protein
MRSGARCGWKRLGRGVAGRQRLSDSFVDTFISSSVTLTG